MVLGISYSDIFHIIIIVLVFHFWRLNTWYNKNIMFLRFFNGFLEDGEKKSFRAFVSTR